MKTQIAVVLAAFALTVMGRPAFDVDAFLGRVLKLSESTPRAELEALVKLTEKNGKEVVEVVARRLADKSTKEDDKLKYVLLRRALYRQSDECFYDYNALTRAIMMVRAYTSGE